MCRGTVGKGRAWFQVAPRKKEEGIKKFQRFQENFKKNLLKSQLK